MEREKQRKRDLAAAKHGMYLAMKAAGVLVNGRILKRGSRFTEHRKEQSRKACRKGNWQ